MNTNAKGARAERRARETLEAEGYAVVRAAGSLGRVDLVALPRGNNEQVVLVQVKCNRGLRPQERGALTEFACSLAHTCRVEVWIYRDRVSEPEREAIP